MRILSRDEGFSLLEVVVALAIMAGGFLAVLQLYSMSIRSVGISEKYLKGTMLAQSKMAEIELGDFDIDKDEGAFDFGEGYRWKVRVSPYDSVLNNEEENIQLSKVMLRVFWFEDGKVHSIDLNTIKLNGSIHPMIDRRLEQVFSGGTAARGSDDIENDRDPLEDLPLVEPPNKQCQCGTLFGTDICRPCGLLDSPSFDCNPLIGTGICK